MYLIVGLGNPGSQYANTRHNAGFMVIDRLIQRHGLSVGKTQFKSLAAEGSIGSTRALLLKPNTFMNRSGQAVGEAARFFKIDPVEQLLVLVDDLALPTGRIRLRAGGSAGGHNGLTDIERALGTRDYPRLRIGIDAPGRMSQVDYVLGRFSADQKEPLDLALDQAADAVACWLDQGIEPAMTRYNAASS